MVDGPENVSAKRHNKVPLPRQSSTLDDVTIPPPTSTAYERLQTELDDQPKILREVTQGKRIGYYRIKGTLGSGNFSQVKLGVHILTKERVAIKILDKGKLEPRTQKLLSREIEAMEKLHHPNILRLYEVIETLSAQYFVIEYASGGELFAYVSSKENERLEELEAKKYFAQIADAVDHLHQNNICHRDIKAENVFFSAGGTAKVGDFGFSIHSHEALLETFCGSPPYAAPELFKDESYIGKYVDIWALGILLYFMLTGGMPFRAENVSKLKKCILEGTYRIPQYLSEQAADIMRKILIEKPESRLSMEGIRAHPWMEGAEYPEILTMSNLQPKLEDPEDIDDQAAQKELSELGVPVELLENVLERGTKNGPRSAITGTYRIALHKATQKRISPPPQTIAPVVPNTLNKKGKIKKSKKKKGVRSRSRFCIIM